MGQLPAEVLSKRFLIIDDARSMRGLLNAILKSMGIARIYEASDGSDALNQLKVSPVDFIFCDWEMPKKDGLELFNDLKQDSNLKDIPFVLVTSMAELDKVKIAIDAGIKDYIVKPFKEDTILNKINNIYANTGK